ncbi:MAG: hypothetical protein IJI08_08560 [Clostridia bacterium]|nr:hypothetical protein [Clostridia bacterium]
MPMQEFLASYAVQVDEDGARRLQRILEQNREAGQELASVFSAAREALTALKKELSDSAGLPNLMAALGAAVPRIPSGIGGLGGGSGIGGVGGSASSGIASLAAFSRLFNVSGAFPASLLSGLSSPGPDPGLMNLRQALTADTSLSIGADFTEADEALADFRARLEAERPKLSVNPSGIPTAVSSAVASIRSMMGSLRITVPVDAVPTVNTDGLPGNGGAGGSTAAGSSSGGTPGNASRLPQTSGVTAYAYGAGGRVAGPTLAMIAEEGKPEYVIPTDDAGRALSLIRSLLGELSLPAGAAVISGLSGHSDDSSGNGNLATKDMMPSSASLLSSAVSGVLRSSLSDLSAAARAALLPAAAAPSVSSVQAPVTINVTAAAAAPEAVARCIYDTAERSLLKTLKGVFA